MPEAGRILKPVTSLPSVCLAAVHACVLRAVRKTFLLDIQVLQELLDMLRDHQNNFHTARLEWIVIWLIVVEVVVGLFECASILGWVGHA